MASVGNFKVTVCFDSTRLVVPCGNGEMLVRDLMDLAAARYRKTVGKTSDYKVTIHSLRSIGGGILDPDDRLTDIVDDREQIVAAFEELDDQRSQHPGADGKSAGTSSPELFYNQKDHIMTRKSEISGPAPCLDPTLQKSESVPAHFDKVVGCDDLTAKDDTICSLKTFDKFKSEDLISSNHERETQSTAFTRSSTRKSIYGSSTMLAWLETQDMEKYEDARRKDPIGCPEQMELGDPPMQPKFFPSVTNEALGTVVVLENDGTPLGIHAVSGCDENDRNMGLLIQDIDPKGRVFQDGRLRRNDCIIEVNGVTLIDRDFSEAQEIFKQALHGSMMELRVIFSDDPPPIPNHALLCKPNAYRKPLPELPCDTDGPNTSTPSKELEEDEPTTVESKENCHFANDIIPTPAKLMPSSVSKQIASTSKKQIPPSVSKSGSASVTKSVLYAQTKQTPSAEAKSLTTSIQKYFPSNSLVPANDASRSSFPTGRVPMTPSSSEESRLQEMQSLEQKGKYASLASSRALGMKIHIQLVKGVHGLGFSITTRDNAIDEGDWPVFIKQILPQGAAITDGRLRSGDQLLEVNGNPMSSKTQNEVVQYLRSIRIGSVVNLVVSRPEVAKDLESQSKTSSVLAKNQNGFNDAHLFLFVIPLRENGTDLGLGISVKGKTAADETGTPLDLGLFVKSIMEGGAAAKDGRLRQDDRLIEVNNYSLLGLSNADGMTTLRYAMDSDGPEPGTISLVITRDKVLHTTNDNQTAFSQLYEQPAERISGIRKEVTVDTCDDHKESSYKYLLNSKVACPLTNWKSCQNISDHQAGRDQTKDPATDQNNARTKENSCESDVKHCKNSESVQSCLSAVPRCRESTAKEMTPVCHASSSVSRRTLSVIDDFAPTPPNWLPEWNNPNHDVTFMSSNASPADVDPMKVFSREALGRQTMSEKRKSHLDPRASSFYQQIKMTKAQNETQSTLKKAVSMESILSQSNLDTPKALGRSGHVRGSLKRCTSVESISRLERVATNAAGVRGHLANDSYKAAVDSSFRRLATDCMETVNEECENDPAGYNEKKKSKNPFKNLFRFGKTKKEVRAKPSETGKDQYKHPNNYKNSLEPDARYADDKIDRIEQEKLKRRSLALSSDKTAYLMKDGVAAEGRTKKLMRSYSKTKICDDDVSHKNYGYGPASHFDQPQNRQSVAGCPNVNFGGYYVNYHDLQAQHNHNAFQNSCRCCSIPQTPRQPSQCCSIPTHSDSHDAFHLMGIHPNLIPNEPCDRGSRCFSGYGSVQMIAQTPRHYLTTPDDFPLHHPKTPMMSVHKVAPTSSDMVAHHVGNDPYCQSQCCNNAIYEALKHQYHQYTDPRYTGTLGRKTIIPSAFQCIDHVDVQKV